MEDVHSLSTTNVVNSVIFKFLKIFILFFVCSRSCCMQAFSSCGQWELLSTAAHGLLIEVASVVVEPGL